MITQITGWILVGLVLLAFGFEHMIMYWPEPEEDRTMLPQPKKEKQIMENITSEQRIATLEEQLEMANGRINKLAKMVLELRERIADLEQVEQRREDREGYEQHGSRYTGRHPHRCACDRCLVGLAGLSYGTRRGRRSGPTKKEGKSI